MPIYQRPSHPHALGEQQARQREADRRLGLHETRQLLTVDRGVTASVPSPGEGQLMVEGTDLRYYAQGEWRTPGGADIDFAHFRDAGGTNPTYSNTGWSAISNWGSFDYGNTGDASINTSTGSVTIPGPGSWWVEVALRLDAENIPDTVSAGVATLHMEGPVGRDIYSSILYVDSSGAWVPTYGATLVASAVFKTSSATMTIDIELDTSLQSVDAGASPIDSLELTAQSWTGIRLTTS